MAALGSEKGEGRRRRRGGGGGYTPEWQIWGRAFCSSILWPQTMKTSEKSVP